MNRITIVSGAPGCGKTTLARSLSQARASGLHLESDLFYSFPAHPVDPATPAAHAQNTIVMRALAAASAAFAAGGYWVFLDGIFGPWFLPIVFECLPPSVHVDYVLLEAERDVALRRVATREGGADLARDKGVVAMHAAFDSEAGLERFRFSTVEQDELGKLSLAPGALLSAVEEALAGGRLQLDRQAVMGVAR